MQLNTLKDNQGATHSKKRVGRGIGSGTGKTAGRGHKGQKSRTGASIRPGFEGGQSPLYRRLPMRGFNNALFTKDYTIINVGVLQKLVDDKRIEASKPVTIQTLQDIGFTKKAKDGLKILGSGELKAKLSVEAAAASQSAQAKIKKAGGSISLPAEK